MLDIKAPLYINEDLGSWDAPFVAEYLLDNGLATSDEMKEVLVRDSMLEKAKSFTLTADIGMGANAVRVGFEDSFYYAPGKRAATNAELVEKLVALIRMMGCEPATPNEARKMLGIKH